MNIKKIYCPVCGKELIRLEPYEDTMEFWCDDCNIDITISKEDKQNKK